MNTIAELFSEQQLQSVQHEDPTPLYFRIYSLLKNVILDGTISNGEQMPTEQQLAETFSVSRITAKRAMDELAAESLVERHRGRGTHVTYDYQPQPVSAPLVGMLQEIESAARHSEVRVLECKTQQPPAKIRALLGLGADDKALHLARVRSRERQPFGYYDSWTVGLKNGLKKRDFTRTARLAVFRKLGLKITHVTQTISAVAASAELAALLDTQEGAPLISLVRNSFETGREQQRLVDYLHVYYHPDRFQYRMDLNLEEG